MKSPMTQFLKRVEALRTRAPDLINSYVFETLEQIDPITYTPSAANLDADLTELAELYALALELCSDEKLSVATVFALMPIYSGQQRTMLAAARCVGATLRPEIVQRIYPL